MLLLYKDRNLDQGKKFKSYRLKLKAMVLHF